MGYFQRVSIFYSGEVKITSSYPRVANTFANKLKDFPALTQVRKKRLDNGVFLKVKKNSFLKVKFGK